MKKKVMPGQLNDVTVKKKVEKSNDGKWPIVNEVDNEESLLPNVGKCFARCVEA